MELVTQERILENIDTHRRHPVVYFFNVMIGALVIPIVVFGRVLVHPASTYIGTPGDSQQTMWFMGWFWHSVLHGLSPFVTNAINYPYGVNLMANTSVLAEGFIFGALQWIVNSAFSYNAMIFVSLWITGIFGTFILREFGVRKPLALVGGIFMQLLPYTSAQLVAHANLSVTMWVFLAFYTVLKTIHRQVKRYWLAGGLLGLFIAGEFYTSLEVCATLALVVVLGLVVAMLLARRETLSIIKEVPLSFYVSCLVVCTVLVVPGLLFFARGPYLPTGGFVPSWYDNVYVTDLSTFVIPTPAYLLSPVYFPHSERMMSLAMKLTGNMSEQDGYIGIFGLLLLVWSAVRVRRHKFARVFVVLTVLIAILSMGTHLHIFGVTTNVMLPWAFVGRLPVMGQALPSRLMFFADILIVVLVFTAFDDVLEGNSLNRRRLNNVVVAITIFLLTWMPLLPYPRSITPVSFKAISNGGTLYQDLKGYPTLVLSDNFFDTMQAFADSKYAYPVVNVYAFQSDSPAEKAYRPASYLTWPKERQGQALVDYLASMIVSTHAQRVLLTLVDSSTAPSNLVSALTELCGAPLPNSTHTDFVWDVPAQLHALWFDGDVWNPGGIFDSEVSGAGQAVGKNWFIHARGEGGTITLTAPPRGLLPSGVRLKLSGAFSQTFVLQPNQSVHVALAAGQTLHVQANTAYLPHAEGESLNQHSISVMVKLSVKS